MRKKHLLYCGFPDHPFKRLFPLLISWVYFSSLRFYSLVRIFLGGDGILGHDANQTSTMSSHQYLYNSPSLFFSKLIAISNHHVIGEESEIFYSHFIYQKEYISCNYYASP